MAEQASINKKTHSVTAFINSIRIKKIIYISYSRVIVGRWRSLVGRPGKRAALASRRSRVRIPPGPLKRARGLAWTKGK